MLLKSEINKTAINFNEKNISYKQLLSAIHFFSSLYYVKETDKVAIFSENKPGWIYAFYSVWQNSSIALPVDYLSTAKELAYILKESKPKVIFYSSERLEVLSEAISEINDYNPELINIDNYENVEFKENTNDLTKLETNKTAVIIYTSGTTGEPKGVMLSFKNLISNITAVSEKVEIYNSKQVVLILLPLHHVFPLVGSLIAPLSTAGTVAISPSMTSDDILKTLQENKVSIIIGVPRLYSALRKGIMDKIKKNSFAKTMFNLAKSINSYSFSRFLFKTVHKKFGGNIKYLISGGAALDPSVSRDFQILGFEVLEGYGMTEASPMITFTRPGKIKIGSAGEALPGTKIEIRNEEIVAKGDNIMQGYYLKPEETTEVLKNGWLYTGDVGHLDKNGFLHITGRKKEIIVLSNGKNINPIEIEFKLESLIPFSKELAVFEKDDVLQLAIVPDKKKVKELAVENIENEIKTKAVNTYNKQVSSYKRIFKIHIFNEELPKTRLGKIQRFKLVEKIENKYSSQNKTNNFDSEEYRLIKTHIENDKNIEVAPDDHLEFDLALDSLDKVSLQVFIENTFGVKINAEKIAEYDTVKKLSEFVTKMKTKVSAEKINWGDIVKEKINVNLPKSGVIFWFIIKLLKLFFKLYFRFEIKGKENLTEQPFILAPNHQSFLDGMFVASGLKTKILRNSYFYTKAKHVKKNWLRRIAEQNNIIIVDINQDLKLSIQLLAKALQAKRNIVIFPEGTRTHNGKIGDFKKTFAILSKELKVPVIPVSITGAFDALPRGRKFPTPLKKIKVEFLKPVFPTGQTYFTITEQTRDTIQENCKC